MNYWIVLCIVFGWFPVLQTILYLNERDRGREGR